LRRLVALKFVRPDRLDTRSLERFEREARAGGRLSHPAIVRTLAFDGASDPAWIAQELVEGSWTLKDFLDELRAEDKTPEGYYKRAAELMASLADGLEAAHQAGVIHRDIKPQNILIAPDDSPKLTDFGLARVADDSFVSVTGDFAGTYYYMSPEQVTAKRIGLDQRTDIFSLGVVLYELLSLRRPFEGDTTHQISQKILFFEPPQPSKIRSQCPRELSVICGKALEKDPDRRYPSMAEFAADLRRHLSNQPIQAKPPGALLRGLKWARRNPGPSVGVGVGAAALVLISGVALVALDQAQRAERGEQLAKDNAEEAKRNATTAQLARDEATAKANDVLSLSAQKDHDDLVAAAEQLWPASSEMVPRYEEWLSKARDLIEGRPADDAKGLKKRPSLVEHKAKLAELRREALPLSEEQIRVDRETHPQYVEWLSKSADLLWRSRMLALEPWPEVSAVEAELGAEQPPGDADGLNALAWKLVDPKQPILGEEVRALLLAKRALDAASEDERAGIRDTYAWALFRNGKLDEALAEMKTALSEPGGEELKQSAKDLEKAVQQWQGDEVAKRRERRESLSKEVKALAAVVNERRTFEYTDAEKTWWDRQLRVLVQNLETFQNPDSGLMGSGVNPDFAWGVQKRHDFAKSVREQTLTSAEAKRRWDEAILAIAKSEKYRDTVFPGGGLLTPQEGLLPLGADPQSSLWEFWHVQSGDEPERDKDGNFVRQKSGAHELVETSGQGTGIVLVLIPGGTFWMGAQKTDPAGQNYDPEAQIDESVHRVTLSPYFLSKYELTQGQWSRFTGLNPSNYKSGFDGTVGSTNPVEQVGWLTCERVMRGLGLELPSEAQWEFGAGGGTSSVWWTGSAKESLADKVNLADQSFVAAGGPAGQAAWWPEFKDGFAVHAPVGRLAANGFGLHEVCGNVWEWCFDAYDGYTPDDATDPRVADAGSSSRVFRGGSFSLAASRARSAYRGDNTPETRGNNLGLRPSRALRLASSPLHSGK
jgi:formylglycine-generating enzyme required for sulfatase activity